LPYVGFNQIHSREVLKAPGRGTDVASDSVAEAKGAYLIELPAMSHDTTLPNSFPAVGAKSLTAAVKGRRPSSEVA
jgi:hypothetical protein